jgi:hypothetical protein
MWFLKSNREMCGKCYLSSMRLYYDLQIELDKILPIPKRNNDTGKIVDYAKEREIRYSIYKERIKIMIKMVI